MSTPVLQIKGSIRDSEEGRRTYRPKRCHYNNKDEVKSPNILSNDNYQASFQKFSQRKLHIFVWFQVFLSNTNSVGWGCRIHQLYLSRESRPLTNKCLGFDIQTSDDEVPVVHLWGIWSTPSLSLLPDPLWTVRIPTMS